MKYIIPIVVALMAVSACESDLDTYREFVAQGEDVTVGAIHDVALSLGVNKLQMDMAITADPKVKQIRLMDADTEVVTLDVVRNSIGEDTLTYQVGLEEKVYNFKAFALDGDGNSSIPYEFVATVYGDRYKESLAARGVDTTYDQDAQEVLLTLAEVEANLVESKIEYTNADNEAIAVVVSNETNTLTVADAVSEGDFTITSYYSPPLKEGQEYFETFEIKKTMQFPKTE